MAQRHRMEQKSMLMLALRIAIAWTAFSLLCLALWVLFLETGRFFGNAKGPREPQWDYRSRGSGPEWWLLRGRVDADSPGSGTTIPRV
jgi:hypothetical protein